MIQPITGTSRRLQHSSLSDVAFDALRRQIISLELAPGLRLNLDKVAEDFGISATPLREALNRLAAQKLVRIEAYRGFIVEPLLNEEQLRNLSTVRHLLEQHAISASVRQMDDAALDVQFKQVEEMDRLIARQPFDAMGFNELDQQFHTGIVAAVGNDVLVDTYKSLNVHVQIARLFQQRGIQHSSPANEEHRALVTSIAKRDEAAALKALKTHIDNGQARLLGLLARQKKADHSLTK